MNSIDDIVNNLFNTENETSALLTKNDTLYIITKNEVNAVLNEKVKDFWARDGYFIVIQPIKRLQFNILKLDKIVPYQRLITENEKEELINKIKDVACLPEISRFDPIAKILCLRPGMISVSERPSKTAIIEKYYRLCLNV
jgi:DNA-directed RNA polymerase subunit H (RpoH/RPB5)